MLVQLLELGSLYCLLDDCLLEEFLLLDFLVHDWLTRAPHSLFAIGAVQVVEYDSGAVVHFLNLLLGAVEVVDVAAFVDDAWLLAYGCHVAN